MTVCCDPVMESVCNCAARTKVVDPKQLGRANEARAKRTGALAVDTPTHITEHQRHGLWKILRKCLHPLPFLHECSQDTAPCSGKPPEPAELGRGTVPDIVQHSSTGFSCHSPPGKSSGTCSAARQELPKCHVLALPEQLCRPQICVLNYKIFVHLGFELWPCGCALKAPYSIPPRCS